MTPVIIARLAREIAAAMETFPRLNQRDRLILASGCNVKLDQLQEAYIEFLAEIRRNPQKTHHDT